MSVDKRTCPECKNEVLKAHKHCGRCGVEVPGYEPERIKCVNPTCGTEVLKSFAFCPSCATPTANEDEAFKGALDLLGQFAEQRTAFAQAHGALPSVEADAVDLGAVNELLKANTKTEGEESYLEMGPVVVELIKSVAGLATQDQTHSAHMNGHLVHLGDGMGKLCSAVLAIGRRVETRIGQLEESLKALGDTSRGRRAIVRALERPGPEGANRGGDADDVDPRRCRLALNAAVKATPTLFDERDVGRVTELTNQGHGLKAIAAYDPALGVKMQTALEGVVAAS